MCSLHVIACRVCGFSFTMQCYKSTSEIQCWQRNSLFSLFKWFPLPQCSRFCLVSLYCFVHDIIFPLQNPPRAHQASLICAVMMSWEIQKGKTIVRSGFYLHLKGFKVRKQNASIQGCGLMTTKVQSLLTLVKVTQTLACQIKMALQWRSQALFSATVVSAGPVCRQFWKARNYDIGLGSKATSQSIGLWTIYYLLKNNMAMLLLSYIYKSNSFLKYLVHWS